MPPINSEEYRLLYTDEYGEDVGLDEVQLLDPPLEERVPALSKMLNSSDPYLSYQSTLVLAAWGKDIALDKLEEYINKEDISNKGFSPNRITGEDNVYDELSYAVHLYGLSEGNKERMLKAFKKILAIYPDYYFESKLKLGLLSNDFVELIPFIEKAINNTLSLGKTYQASQLLPVLTKLDPDKGWQTIQQFTNLPASTPNPKANIAEALKYYPSEESLELLNTYTKNQDPAVALEAEQSLKYFTDRI
ncbi:hypothetical protein [Hahella ganghwensis]|uniref:hypothetical protein n=1 Tax=Hahella ganghwensis TaxID=286420 RepID=UPI0003749C10|nr:hypothetical protein [Hahella ganghwensis]